MQTDQDFLATLKSHLGPDAALPLFHKTDGSIDREKTLALPCYEGFKP